jgi:prepilin-type N-terminal cleavage/methylation domain-containing protein
MPMPTSIPRAPRADGATAGFTLIELLAVMLIIAILATALLTTGVLKAFTAAEETQTHATMNELHVALGSLERDLGSFPSGDWRKFRAFATANATRLRGLEGKQLDGGSESNAGSEILYLLFDALGQSPGVDEKFLKDTDGDGYREYCDAWGNPLVYLCTLTDDAGQKTKVRSSEGEGFDELYVRAVPKTDDPRRSRGSWQLVSAGKNEIFGDDDDIQMFGKD